MLDQPIFSIETIRTLVEIVAILFLPALAWMLRTISTHTRKIDLLEQKVNAEIYQKVQNMEKKLEQVDEKIEHKIDNLSDKLDQKFDSVMVTIADFATSIINNQKRS